MRFTILILVLTFFSVAAASPVVLVRVFENTDNLFENLSTAIFSPLDKNDSEEMLPSKIRFVGDVMLARHVETLLKKHGSAYPYSNLTMSPSTVMVGNFEAALPTEHVHTPDFTFAFSVDPKFLNDLHAVGMHYLSIANNHTFDFASSGLLSTREYLLASAFTAFGDPNDVSSSSLAFVPLDGGVVGMLALHTTGQYPAIETVQPFIEALEKKSDIQIVYIHWGTEYQEKHNKIQAQFAYSLIDNGVDAIIGHHPHVVQDVGMYKGKPIFYSLGNFIFDQYFSDNVQVGLGVDVEFLHDMVVYNLIGFTSKETPSAPREMTSDETKSLLLDLSKRSESSVAEQVKKGIIVTHY